MMLEQQPAICLAVTMLIVMLLKDSSCGARQRLRLLHYIDLEFRPTQMNLRFSYAVWWKIIASTCIS